MQQAKRSIYGFHVLGAQPLGSVTDRFFAQTHIPERRAPDPSSRKPLLLDSEGPTAMERGALPQRRDAGRISRLTVTLGRYPSAYCGAVCLRPMSIAVRNRRPNS